HLRKTHALCLTGGLRVARLILLGVRHQDPGPVAKLHRPTSPAPAGMSLTAKQFTRFPRQRCDHLLRQPNARPAVSARARTRRREPFGHALGDPAVDGSLARTIRREGLLQEHRECHRRRILSLPMLRQQCLGLLQQLRAGKRVEEIHRLEPLSPASDARLMLLGLKSGTTISQGWPRGWWAGCLVTNILPIPASLPHIFQSLTVRCSPRLPLSKCHVRRENACTPCGWKTRPATVAPAGSNRSSRRGNEAAEAFGEEGP